MSRHRHVIIKEEVQSLVERNIVAEIILNCGSPPGKQNVKTFGPNWPDGLKKGSGPVGQCYCRGLLTSLNVNHLIGILLQMPGVCLYLGSDLLLAWKK